MATSANVQTSVEQCPECGSSVRPSGTEQVCRGCGLVVDEDEIDRGPEWRAFDSSDQGKIRASPTNPDRQGKGLGSEIGYWNERDWKMTRKNKHHSRAKMSTKKERNLRYVIGEIERMGSALELSDGLVKQGKRLFRTLHESGDVLGRDLDTLASTALYTACRVNKKGITPEEFERVSRTDAPLISRRHKWLCDTLGIGSPPPCPKQRIRVVASELDLSRDVVNRAVGRVEEIDDDLIYRGSPSTLAAALLWDESDESQTTVADAAGVTPAGVRGRFRSVS